MVYALRDNSLSGSIPILQWTMCLDIGRTLEFIRPECLCETWTKYTTSTFGMRGIYLYIYIEFILVSYIYAVGKG